jgi:hypothetical protein
MLEKLQELQMEVTRLEKICLRLEAERDAHMQVIRELFQSLIPEDSSHGCDLKVQAPAES